MKQEEQENGLEDHWQEFLDKKNSRPLYGFLWEPDITPIDSVVKRVGIGNELKPEDLLADDLIMGIEKVRRNISGWESDFVQTVSACMGVPWMEAITGCRIIVHEDTIWAGPRGDIYERLIQSEFDSENPWLKKLVALHLNLVTYANNRFPVCLPVMHGPLDILSALRGPEQFCLDLYDRPAEVREAAKKIGAIWLKVAQRLMQLTPPFAGGWFTRMNLFMNEQCATPQADVTTLISSKTYREFGYELDQRLVEKLPGQPYHTHSTAAHVLETISNLGNLKSLQVTIDPNGPPLKQLTLILKNCQKRVPLLIAVWNFTDFRLFCNELPPQGLAVVLIKKELTQKEEFNDLIKSLRRRTNNGL